MQQNEQTFIQPIDDALAIAIRGGDATAFERLFNSHWATVYLFLLTTVRSSKLAEHGAELVFKGVRDHSSRFNSANELKHFIALASRNAALFALKKNAVASRLLDLPGNHANYDDALHQLGLIEFNSMEKIFIRGGTNLSSVAARVQMEIRRLFTSDYKNNRDYDNGCRRN
jgi:hypothetical protein